MKIERTLELTIKMDEDGVSVDVYEPESGECSTIEAPLSFDEHPEFDSAIGNEIYSWLSIWKDAEEEDNEDEQKEEREC